MPERNFPSTLIMLSGTILLAIVFLSVCICHGDKYKSFNRSDTRFEHLTVDPETGNVYVGAVNFLFQLTSDLTNLVVQPTGPQNDSKECLPPVNPSDCTQVKLMDNHNKLLLINPYGNELITCGSLFQGICEKRSLGNISYVLFHPERPVDTQYVAANDPNVTTVGLVGLSKDKTAVLFVGRGYTSKGAGGIPPITTRNLELQNPDSPESHPIFSYEDTAKLAVAGRLSEYNHHFVKSFIYQLSVYFLFYRRDLKSPSREYKTYVSRICLGDMHYYSYVEVPLVCQAAGKNYNLLQAAYVSRPGKGLAQGALKTEGEALFATFSVSQAATAKATEESALCIYTMSQIDQMINQTRDLCYTNSGKTADGSEAAYIEYEVKSSCSGLTLDTLNAYPCGYDHTPSPMASRIPIETPLVFEVVQGHLVAVVVTVEMEHTIVFMGDAKGHLHKVFVKSSGEAERYSTRTIQSNTAINTDLAFDSEQKHLYITTPLKVLKLPVSECSEYLDCQSCLVARDPYCGWCILQGRCSRRSECARAEEGIQWLWSYEEGRRCLRVQTLTPANISREEQKQVFVNVADLPILAANESYTCQFADYSSPAIVTESGVVCWSPEVQQVPSTKPGTDHVTVRLQIAFFNITLTTEEFTFYDCSAVQKLSINFPCRGCVSSQWGCNWCVLQHHCTHNTTCEDEMIIFNENFVLPYVAPPTLPTKPLRVDTTVVPTTLHPTTVPLTTIATTIPATLSSTVATRATRTMPPTTLLTSVPTTAVVPTNATASPTALPTTVPTTPSPTTVPTTGAITTVPTTQLTTASPLIVTTTAAETGTTSPVTTEYAAPTTTLADEALTTVASTSPPTTFSAPPHTSPQTTVVPPTSRVPDAAIATTFASPLNSTDQETVPADTTVPPADPTEPPPTRLAVPTAPRPDHPATWVPPVPPSDWPVEGVGEWKEPDSWVETAQIENDTAVFSAAAVLLSGDGDVENPSPAFLHLLDTEVDYHFDPGSPSFSIQSYEGLNKGPVACPCVDDVQGSSLLPVNTERKITLAGQNLHFFQDPEGDYECVFVIEGRMVVVEAFVEGDDNDPTFYFITCQVHQYTYSTMQQEYNATVYVQRRPNYRVDSTHDLHITLYNCSVGRRDCSRCQTADTKYACVWCGGGQPSCVYEKSCVDGVEQTCPAPVIHSINPMSGLQEGGTVVTITGSNLGQRFEDIQNMVTVAGIPCQADPLKYEVSTRIVCYTAASSEEVSGRVTVEVTNGGRCSSAQPFTYQNPVLNSITPSRGPKAGGTSLTLHGAKLLTGRPSDIKVFVGDLPCLISADREDHRVQCFTAPSNQTGDLPVTVTYGDIPKKLNTIFYSYTDDPNITIVHPDKSFLGGGRVISVSGQNLDAVQTPLMMVQLIPKERWRRSLSKLRSWRRRRKRRATKGSGCTERAQHKFVEFCQVNNSSFMTCKTPSIKTPGSNAFISVHFVMDNLCFDFNEISPTKFTYKPDPILKSLNAEDPSKPYRHKPGSVLSVEGENLDLAITKEEVVAMVGEGICAVRTLTADHLYCEPPLEQPAAQRRRKRESMDTLPEFIVQMGNLPFELGKIQYDAESPSNFPIEAQIGLGVGASIVALIVLIIVLIYRRKSKQALRDYKKVQIQLENLETSVRDRCKKEFTDLMTEMMDLSSDLVGTGMPFLDYKTYAERIFFPGHRESPLQRDLDVPESRRQTVEQGLVQLSNLLNSKLFLTKFIHTLESQRVFSPRDRAYVASLLTVSLHGKLEYYTDILKTLLNDLVEQNVAKNPKLMLRRTETVVEKLLTNWMSICLYTFLRDSAGESLYMLFRAIKHQVDKGPVDAVSGKAKYTLNDNRLLREDVEYRTLTLNVLVQGEDAQPSPVKVLDCDTITQVKEKIIDQIHKGVTYSLRPHVETLDLEWRSGLAGHLILSDEDLTSVLQGNWKRLNTLQHYKVTDGATVALVPRLSKHIHHENHDYAAGEKTPMLEDADEGGIKVWHLVKASEEPELPRHRRGSLKERERAKAIPEIYLTRLLSMKGTLQKFVDDLFQVILSTSRPVPLAVKYFFDLLDEQALHHGITDTETIHIWKTNSLPLRFWINIIKNPHFTFDVQVSDNVDAMLSVIAQTFMDSCTIAEHKLGRDSPINKLLYARDIPRYKQMVERYYADIRQTISASDQEMNSALAELSRNNSSDMNSLVALHELYKYINKYYDQIITALEEDPTAQKMQLGYRLQQIAASVENKVTDL
ncbi:plexin-B1 isoform X2 [Scyliorhinus canicula]|uniref:plexin-B1 isoform X2 n=1 Tax=Scyliorhinus canicula TaxID=7830 RepID=UPI0018F57DE3|nr:plexin-B1 isoform X2 [Scyliorhinus canicula]